MSENISTSPRITKRCLPIMPSACDVTRLEHTPCDVTRIDETPGSALDELCAQFRAMTKVHDDYPINAAFVVKNMRTLVEQGAAGTGVTWCSWAKKLGLPEQRVQRYIRIADSDDPHALREEFLRRDRERARKSRAKEKAIDPERQILIKWSLKAPLAQVEYVLQAIEKGKMQL